MNNERYPIAVTEICGAQIRSVLDNGFIRSPEVAPEVHAHAFFEILVAVEGAIAVDVRDEKSGNTAIVMTEGEVCFIPPGIYHSTRSVSEFPVKLAIRFAIDKTGLANSGQKSVYDDVIKLLSSYVLAQKLDNGSGIFEITCEIRQEISHGGFASEEYLRLLLGQLYIRLFRLLGGEESVRAVDTDNLPETVEENRQIRIEEYIFTHLGEQITEEDLAREMNLSKRQLSRVLRQLFGKSFRQMLIDARLNRAAQLLAETELSVEEVAYLVGYTSLSGFYTAFRGRFSISVGQYRKKFCDKK